MHLAPSVSDGIVQVNALDGDIEVWPWNPTAVNC